MPVFLVCLILLSLPLLGCTHSAKKMPGPTLISFIAVDGARIHANEYGDGPRGLVLAHGGRFTKESWADQAPELAKAGFRVIAIDFRGRGESTHGSSPPDTDAGYPLDVLATMQYLRASGARSISLVGASFGGWAIAEALLQTEPNDIDRLVLLAASPIERPEQLPGRKLYILSRGDPHADGSLRLTEIRDQFERASEPKMLVLLDGSAHAQHIFATDQGPRLLDEIVRFLTEQ